MFADISTAAAPGEPLEVGGLKIVGVSGVHPRPITIFHVTSPDLRILHAADSGYVPLAEHPADVAFLPVGRPSPSCSPENALKMALDVKPRIVVAMHGNQAELRKTRRIIQKELPGTEVLTPDPCELVRLSLL